MSNHPPVGNGSKQLLVCAYTSRQTDEVEMAVNALLAQHQRSSRRHERSRRLRQMVLWLAFLLAAIALVACDAGEDFDQVDSTVAAEDYERVALETIQVTDGQILYVPVYPEIYYGDGQLTLDLDITLGIHNADLDHAIIITSARYHDHEGNFVKEYVPEALQLPPLAALTFAIASQDAVGDVGASFVVEWVADTSVADPVVEAVMIGPQNQQGLSFVSVARVISEIE